VGELQANPKPNQAIEPDGTTRTIKEPVVRRVWVAAGGRCTFCNRYLLGDDFTGEPVFTGQLAHIVGWDTAEGSPRGDDDLPTNQRNGAENLMLICYDQHRVIDTKSLWEAYGKERLREFKRKHERKIKELTALADPDATTVIRLIGNIHGGAVQLATSAVSAALLADGKFPNYALVGVNEYEIDLRTLPGEDISMDGYWQAALLTIQERLRLLRALVAKETITDLSIFALARVPLLIALGAVLDDTVPTKVYPKRRGNDEGWGWPEDGQVVDFEWRTLNDGTDEATEVTVLFSVSGSIEMSRLPVELAATRIYEIKPVASVPNFDVVASAATVDNFALCWRAVIAQLETHEHVARVNLVPAVPTTVAVAIGRHINRSVHPPMRVYDRLHNSADYAFTLEVPQ